MQTSSTCAAALLSKARPYVSIEMIAAAMGGKPFRWPAGTYVSNGKFDHIMMAWETSITKDGCHLKEVKGTPEEEAALEKKLCTSLCFA